jgi:hypothetical protein
MASNPQIKAFLTDDEMEAANTKPFLSDAEMQALELQARKYPTEAEGGTIAPAPPWSSYLPSPRSAARIVGGMAGGAIGTSAGPAGMAAGGAFGSSVGESLYQILEHIRGGKDAPHSGAEAALQQAIAMTQGAAQEGIPAAIIGKAPGMLQRGAEDKVAQLAKPATEGEKANVRSVAKELTDKLPVTPTTSTSKALQTMRGMLDSAVRTLEGAYASVPLSMKFKSAPIKTGLEAAKQELYIQGKPVPGAESQIHAYDSLIQWMTNNGTPPEQADLGQPRELVSRLTFEGTRRRTSLRGRCEPDSEGGRGCVSIHRPSQ